MARKEVREVQVCHALVKFVPLDRFKAGTVARAVQYLHALEKSMSSLASVLKVQTPKEVREVQLYHV